MPIEAFREFLKHEQKEVVPLDQCREMIKCFECSDNKLSFTNPLAPQQPPQNMGMSTLQQPTNMSSRRSSTSEIMTTADDNLGNRRESTIPFGGPLGSPTK